MKYALLITGVLAAVALAAPGLVVLGYFALIIPGLILTFAPTAFVYLAMTVVISRLLPKTLPVPRTAVALGVALLLGWLVMQPFRAAAIAEYQAELADDVSPAQPLALHGRVRIEMPDRRADPECDYLCLALLDSPGVESVTVVTAGRGKPADPPQTAAYELVSPQENPGPGLFPTNPGQLVREHPALAHLWRDHVSAAKAAEADWAVRLAGAERLRKTDPVAADRADWVLRFDARANRRHSKLRRVSVCDSTGAVRFRRSYVERAVPARLFYFGFAAYGGGGPIVGSFHVGRQRLASGDLSLRLEPALLSAIECPMPRFDAQAIDRLREQVERALDDPTATPVRLDLARRYLGLFFFDAAPQDHPLIARIVADGRVRDLDEPIGNVFSKDKTPPAMRVAYAERIVMKHSSARLRHRLAEALAGLPAGAFAEPAPAHLKIWNTPSIYQEAGPFVARLADLGPQRALPALEGALDTAIELPTWSQRRPLIAGIQDALVRLGPQALAVAPRVRELFLRRPSSIMNTASDADAWRFVLGRMGVAIEDLPFFPNQSVTDVEQIRRRVADKLRRYDRDHAPDNAI